MYRVLAISTGPEVKAWLKDSTLADCKVDEAAGSADALRQLRRRSYDAVITSPCTTVVEDLALLEEMRHVRSGVKTIVLSPRATPEDVIAALRARVFALFSAPFDAAEVTAMVKRAVEESDGTRGIDVVSAKKGWLSVRVDSRLVSAERLVQFLDALPSELAEPEKDDLLLAFREILLNAMEHGAAFDAEKVIDVSAVRTERAIVFYVHDPGPGFRPEEVKHAAIGNPPDDPVAHTEIRAAEGRRPGGYGMLLAQKIVDELIYNEVGNEVLLIKHVP
jgi:anti-sigma regulatory factor (Ser/Thr protein kinase)/CheY-like chemotaxis protein